MTLSLLCLILALICFLLATFNVPARINLVALGLAFFMLDLLLAGRLLR